MPYHSFVSEKSVVTWHFWARGKKALVTMKWYKGISNLQSGLNRELIKYPISG
jgi:hypothetical protein